MVLTDIHNIFVNRKSNIIQMLKEQEDSITFEKKHELMGAMNEIELILKTIEYYKTNGKKETSEINLLHNPEEEEHNTIFARIFKGKKD